MTLETAIQRYGQILMTVWPGEGQWCCFVIPQPELTWVNTATGKPVAHIYCNKDMAASLIKALQNVVDRGLAGQLKTLDGCLDVRMVRGEDHPSAHSYAGAIDINASTNVLGTDGDMSDELAKCFTDSGFTWGKTFTRKDPMHMSWLGW